LVIRRITRCRQGAVAAVSEGRAAGDLATIGPVLLTGDGEVSTLVDTF
jgi:hypothetical protein